MGDSRPRVLLIGKVDSIHVARWLRQFSAENLDFFLFPSGPNRRIHPELLLLMGGAKGRARFYLHWSASYGLLLWAIDRFPGMRLRSFLLGRWLRKTRPSFVHAIEIQGAGYLALDVEPILRSESTPLLVTNWGSDIFWFGRFKAHSDKIRRLMTLASHYSAECQRDIELAVQHGFLGSALPVIPNAGGMDSVEAVDEYPSALNRDVIMVKGYDGWVGRARVALRALERIEPDVAPYEIVVFSANFRTWILASQLNLRSNLRIRVFGKNRLTHSDVQALFRRSVIYVGVSKSDGISTSMLEAMAAGAIPVQTATSCCNEWFKTSGVAIEGIDIGTVAAAIQRGLSLAKDPRNAAVNRSTIRSKASAVNVAKIAKKHYDILLAAGSK